MNPVVIREPVSERDWQSVWELNHAVFSEELRQHPLESGRQLIDRFHAENIYRIAWIGDRAAGMIAAHFDAPYSAVERFGEVMAAQLITGQTAEIRLFAAHPDFRRSPAAAAPAAALLAELGRRGVTRLIISGYEARKLLYEHVGFRIVGDAVQDGDARFYPMIAELDDVLRRCQSALERYAR